MDRVRMNPNDSLRIRRRRFRGVGVTLLLMLAAGCQYVVLGGYLLGGRPSIEPDFDASTKLDMTDKDVTVAVICYVPRERKWEFQDLDHRIAKLVSHRLREHHIQVVRPELVRAWLDEHPDWDRPAEVGAEFGTNYVIYIDLHEFTLYEPNSANLFRGRTEATISVTAMNPNDDEDGEEIYKAPVISQYPIHQPRDTHQIPKERFLLEYLSHLSEEIGRNFYEHYSGDDISAAT